MVDLNGDSKPDLHSPEFREAARLLGSIRSEKKAVAVRRNLEKARAMKAEIDRIKKERMQ